MASSSQNKRAPTPVFSNGCIQNELGCRDLSGFETRRPGSSLTFGNLTGLRIDDQLAAWALHRLIHHKAADAACVRRRCALGHRCDDEHESLAMEAVEILAQPDLGLAELSNSRFPAISQDAAQDITAELVDTYPGPNAPSLPAEARVAKDNRPESVYGHYFLLWRLASHAARPLNANHDDRIAQSLAVDLDLGAAGLWHIGGVVDARRHT